MISFVFPPHLSDFLIHLEGAVSHVLKYAFTLSSSFC